MITLDERFSRGEQVVYSELDPDTAVLLDLQTKGMFSLNETGILIWQALEQPRTPREIATVLTASYELPEPEALFTVRDFIRHLEEHSLVRPAAPGG